MEDKVAASTTALTAQRISGMGSEQSDMFDAPSEMNESTLATEVMPIIHTYRGLPDLPELGNRKNRRFRKGSPLQLGSYKYRSSKTK